MLRSKLLAAIQSIAVEAPRRSCWLEMLGSQRLQTELQSHRMRNTIGNRSLLADRRSCLRLNRLFTRGQTLLLDRLYRYRLCGPMIRHFSDLVSPSSLLLLKHNHSRNLLSTLSQKRSMQSLASKITT